jgi:hypothetical protein
VQFLAHDVTDDAVVGHDVTAGDVICDVFVCAGLTASYLSRFATADSMNTPVFISNCCVIF